MKRLIIISILLVSSAVFSQDYNPYVGVRPTRNYQPPAVRQYQVSQQPIQKYNPMNNTWQTTYPNSELKYNPMATDPAKSWEYVPKNAQPVYNPFNNVWEFPK